MVIDGPSTSTIFGVSFLGALFAIGASLLIVYTYVTLRLIPKIKRGLREIVAEIGPRAVFEQANFDPVEAMRRLDVSSVEVAAAFAQQQGAAGADAGAVRIIFTCEDHGRCIGCSRVLAQFEAIIRHQGEDSFDEIERECYAHLKDQLASDALFDGESEGTRQKRIAARVIEVLVREGCSSSIARSVVWNAKKEDRASFAAWLSAARAGREKPIIVDANDEEDVA